MHFIFFTHSSYMLYINIKWLGQFQSYEIDVHYIYNSLKNAKLLLRTNQYFILDTNQAEQEQEKVLENSVLSNLKLYSYSFFFEEKVFFLKIRWSNFDYLKKLFFPKYFFFRNLHIKISLEKNFHADHRHFFDHQDQQIQGYKIGKKILKSVGMWKIGWAGTLIILKPYLIEIN